MKFCQQCSNYMYMSIEIMEIKYKCKACGFEQTASAAEADAAAAGAALAKATKKEVATDDSGLGEACVLDTTIRQRAGQVPITIDKYTLSDPTLPHDTSGSIKCPNAECTSNTGKSTADVIYIKTNPRDLTFDYICQRCTTRWRTGTT